MGRHSFTVEVNAPVELVWGLWTDLDRAHEWIQGLTRISDVTGPVGVTGTRYTAWFGRMPNHTEVLEADPPHRLRTRLDSRLLRGESLVTLEPDGARTVLTQVFETEGIVPGIAAWIFSRGSYRGSFRGELATFVDLAEQEVGRRGVDVAEPTAKGEPGPS